MRLRDRGTIRKRLVLLRLAGSDLPSPGDKIKAESRKFLENSVHIKLQDVAYRAWTGAAEATAPQAPNERFSMANSHARKVGPEGPASAG